MITHTPPEAVVTLSSTVERLRSDLENVQRELDQALGVWRQALITEKREFQTALVAKQRLWDDQETQWQRMRQSYEERILQLENNYQAQLQATEQNALRSLNDLDETWQRDKMTWHQGASQRMKDLEAEKTTWAAQEERLQSRIVELETRLTEETTERKRLEGLLAQPLSPATPPTPHPLDHINRAAVQDVQEAWETDRLTWQDLMRKTLEEIYEKENAWKANQERQQAFIDRMQDSLLDLEQKLVTLEGRNHGSHTILDYTVDSLENQVAVLASFINSPDFRPSAHR